MNDQKSDKYQPSKEHLLTILSEGCLQDLDSLYINAAEKLREYDKLRIDKDTLILELEKLEQTLLNAREKSCQIKQMQMTYELLNKEYQTELQNQHYLKEQLKKMPIMQKELESLQENIKKAVIRSNKAENEGLEQTNRVSQAMDLLNDIHDASVDVQALKMKNQDIKMYLEKLDKYIDIRLNERPKLNNSATIPQQPIVANTPKPTLGGYISKSSKQILSSQQEYLSLDFGQIVPGDCELAEKQIQICTKQCMEENNDVRPSVHKANLRKKQHIAKMPNFIRQKPVASPLIPQIYSRSSNTMNEYQGYGSNSTTRRSRHRSLDDFRRSPDFTNCDQEFQKVSVSTRSRSIASFINLPSNLQNLDGPQRDEMFVSFPEHWSPFLAAKRSKYRSTQPLPCRSVQELDRDLADEYHRECLSNNISENEFPRGFVALQRRISLKSSRGDRSQNKRIKKSISEQHIIRGQKGMFRDSIQEKCFVQAPPPQARKKKVQHHHLESIDQDQWYRTGVIKTPIQSNRRKQNDHKKVRQQNVSKKYQRDKISNRNETRPNLKNLLKNTVLQNNPEKIWVAKTVSCHRSGQVKEANFYKTKLNLHDRMTKLCH